MFEKTLSTVLISICFLGAGVVWGVEEEEEAPAPTEEQEIEEPRSRFQQEIVVTAGLPELPTGEELSGEEVEGKQLPDLVESLRQQPGLAAVRRGPINLDPMVRGLHETQVGMFVDGTRTFAAGPARMDSGLSHVTQHVLQRVRVVKGPYALTWGAGAMSAVQLETFRPPFAAGQTELGGRAGFEFEENASRHDGYAGVWGSGERWRFNFLVNQRQGNDYEAGNDLVVPADFESQDARASVGFRPAPNLLLEYLGGYQEQQGIDYPGRILDATYFFTRSHAFEVRWSPAAGPVDHLYAQAYVNRKDHLMNNDEKPTAQPSPERIPPFGIDVRLPTESNTTGGRLHVDVGGGSWEWKVGGDFYRLEQTARRTISRRDTGAVVFEDIVWPGAEIDDLGIFVHGTYQKGRNRLGGTLRGDFVDASGGEVSAFFLENTAGALNQDETNFSAALSARVQPADHWAFTAGVGRAVRTATVLERYSDRFPATKFQVAAEFLGNPELDPEESLELDVGAELSRSGLTVSIDAFWRQIDDYVTVQPDPALPKRLLLSPPTVFRYINGDRAEFWGGELRLDHAVSDRVSWWGALSYVRGDDETFDEPVFGVPPLTGRLGVRYAPRSKGYWIDGQINLVGDQDRVAAARLERPTPGHTTYDLRGGLQISSELSLRVGALNLTDKRYSDHLNSLNPFTGERIAEIGRSLVAGLEYRF